MRWLKFALIALVSLGIFLGVFMLRGQESKAATCEYHEAAYETLDPEALEQELETTGLIGSIHGVAAPLNLAVLSIQEPGNFFHRQQFSLIPANESVKTTLNGLHRHDRVCIHGRATANASPQPHLVIDAIDVLAAWPGLRDYPDYNYTADFPADLENQTQLIAKVHALAAEGKILVVEYQDGVIPIFVERPTAAIANLYRGDIVELTYTIQRYPGQPTHLRLDTDAPEPVKVLDSLLAWHETPHTLSGHLVKFPQSPQLKFDVYAIAVETQGIERTFTLINFTDPDTFTAIRNKLAQIWDAQTETIISGRNALINPAITLEATGMVNIVSSAQANPQILLSGVEDIVLVKETARP
ncbi:MAG: hypothetical protein F6J87_19225 [Spirulina sp. SIO3F2]|nr:hypothetical protein [Spirulina sp. SIO3F2]